MDQLREQTLNCPFARRSSVRQTFAMKQEFVFQIEQDDDMLAATCHDPEMATQGENLDDLIAMIRDWSGVGSEKKTNA